MFRKLKCAVVATAAAMTAAPVGAQTPYRASVSAIVVNRAITYASRADGDVILFRGQPLRLKILLQNPYPATSRGDVVPVAAESDWPARVAIELQQGGARESRKPVARLSCAGTPRPSAPDGLRHLGLQERDELRCQVRAGSFQALTAGRYTLEVGWDEAALGDSPLQRQFLDMHREPIQIELRDRTAPLDELEFRLHEMEYAYFEDRMAEAVSYASSVLSMEPHSVLALATRAKARAKIGQCDGAREDLAAAAASAERHLDVNNRSDLDGPLARRQRAAKIAALDLACQ